MRNFTILLFASAVLIMNLTSCNSSSLFSKEQYLSKFEDFIAITERNYMTYDDDTWAKVNKEFKELSDTEYNRFVQELNSDEHLKIDKMIGRYYSFVAKYKTAKVHKQLIRIYTQAEEFINNISN